MAVIQFEVPDSILDLLHEKFGEDSAPTIARIAFDEWVEWLQAHDRPLSISDMETGRVTSLYQTILVSELPSAHKLSALFKLPLARCRYIVQTLNYLQPQMLRERRLKILRDAYALIDQAQESDFYYLDIPSDCRDLADEILSLIRADQKVDVGRPQRIGVQLRYKLVRAYLKPLGEALNKQVP